jgi:hypothetical protein
VNDPDVDQPQHLERPFFAYGIFRPGQLAFFQLRDFGHRRRRALLGWWKLAAS